MKPVISLQGTVFYMATFSENGYPCIQHRGGPGEFVKAQATEPEDDPALYNLLNPEEYKFRPERMIILNAGACVRNCPQHIRKGSVENSGYFNATGCDYYGITDARMFKM